LLTVLGSRIAIVGNAGGGKSTLARRLGQLLDLPVTHVDSVQYQSGWQRTDDSECDHILEAAAKNDRWIIDGFGNRDVIQRRVDLADTLLLVDFPLWRHYWWATKRQWASRQGQRSELPENCPEFNLAYTRKLFAVMWLVHREYTPWFRTLARRKAIDGQAIVIHHPAQWNRLANTARTQNDSR
jgi:adenylate kinase family enzyme